jgi:hypothetical protein
MGSSGHIQHLGREQIDTARWDACVSNAVNERIYAYSWYLDQMAANWGALVLGDYEAVMPLPWKKKYGIKYIYQPFLTAQLGVFGKHLSSELITDFIAEIPSSYRLTEISLSSANSFEHPQLFMRKNYILPLDKPYAGLFSRYNENNQRNCRKALQSGCEAEKGFDVEKVIALATAQMKQYGVAAGDNVTRFRSLYKELDAKNMAFTYGIAQNKNLLSSAVFFISKNRAYYILVGNDAGSKSTGASHALIDAFIKDHAGSNIILDFEGSDIPGLAAFYACFGAVQENYPFLKINRLPFFLKWLKK